LQWVHLVAPIAFLETDAKMPVLRADLKAGIIINKGFQP
jgi:hypothetical protein